MQNGYFRKTDPINSEIVQVSPRPTVEIHLPDGRVLNGPRFAEVGEFLQALPEADNPPIVGAIVNGELRELSYPIKMDSYVQPITMGEEDGMRIYRRSLVFLLETVFHQVFSKAKLSVDHSLTSGGYYCQVEEHPPLSADELFLLSKAMFELVDEDLPLIRQEIPIEQAIALFQERGEQEKVRLLSHRTKNYLTMYQLRNYSDYHHGYMVPSTGYLRWFQLLPMGEAFVLRFPHRATPTQLLPSPEDPILLNTFRQYGNWLKHLGIDNVGALNDAIKEKRSDEIILVSEALHEQFISEIAYQVANRSSQVRVITIAGPSSSGKTTFSKRLSVQLLARGISPFPLAMDNYFLDREATPLDEEGKPDFESIIALDRKQLVLDLRRLIAGEEVTLPHFNFVTGKRETGESVQLNQSQIIIIEGIHGLNPDLLSDIPSQRLFRIYVSALTQLNLDRHNRISTTDTRLIRRIVRDARERGYTAWQTISRWESVRRGERRYIFPFQSNADAIFNSALVYELSALKPLAEPLLRQVHFGRSEYVEAKRLLAFLEWFLPLENDSIPDNSILREFIGESALAGFTLWKNHK